MSRTMNDIKESIEQWLLDHFSSRVVQFEKEEKQIEMVEEFIQEELNMGTNESLVEYIEMDFTAEVVLEMLTYTNAYLKDNFGDENGVKVFTVQIIFDTFALIIAYEYQEAIRCCTFDALERELDEDDISYCDTCKSVEPLYKLQVFKQYHGQHCRSCYELIDEDADEEDDESYIISIELIKAMHLHSHKGRNYYHKLCMQIIKNRCPC